MPRRFVDLSIYLENDVVSDPPPFGPKIQYHRHEDTAGQIAGFFPGLEKEDLPDGQGWAVENVNLSTHNGTHLDAPYHFHPTMNKGERAITIDEVPLEWCFQPGVKLDFRDKPDGHVITAREVEGELSRIGHELKPLEIVVVNTRAGSRYGNDDYVNAGCGMGYDATMFLLEKGIRLTGTDAWSWDAPFYWTAQKWAKDHTPRSSGKATRPAATSATAISRSCTISRRCRATASPSPASRTRSVAPRPAGRAQWRSSRNEPGSEHSPIAGSHLDRPAREQQAEAESRNSDAGADAQAGEQRRPGERCGAGARCHEHHDDIDGGVEEHRDQAEHEELQPHRAEAGFDELRQEGEEKGGRLGVQGLDEDAVAKGTAGARAARRRGDVEVRLARRLDAEPYQVEGAGELEDGEGFGAREHQRRDPDGAGRDMHQTADAVPRLDARPTLLPSASVRAAT